jgi:hypothetical protein
MAEPTLIGVFGANVTQSATELIISKADLATVGLTASATNTPESLLAAIIALAQAALVGLKQKLSPNVAQTGFISGEQVTIHG